MKIFKYIKFIFLFPILFWACNEEAIEIPDNSGVSKERVQVSFDMLLPLHNLPKTKAITDDSQIDNFTIWVYTTDGQFIEKIKKGDTYTDPAGKIQPKVEFSGKNGDPLFIALEKNSNENIKLYMVANTTINDNIKELSDLKNASFKYNGNEVYMPMSGSSSNVNIHSNQKGILTLQRCLTKVMVNAKGTSDFFQLKSIKIYNSPKEKDMNVFHQKITALSYDSTTENFYKEGFVDEENNKGIIYVPDFKWDETSKPYIIIGGEYTPKKNNGPSTTKYYKLEFVKRNIPITPLDHNSFVHIFELERNYAYIFNIDFLAEFAGYPTVAEAREKQATNLISRKDPIEIITFRNENIMDITTDNHVYLGVTSSQVTAELNTDKNYYTAQLHITTNNPKGWAIDDLPEGDYATCASWKPDSEDHVVSIQSTWIYLDCKKHKPNEIVKIFIYGGNIRKKIEITIRE